MEKFSLDEACERLRREKLHYQNAYEKLISGKTYSTLNGELEESTRRVAFYKEKSEHLHDELKEARNANAQLKDENRILSRRVDRLGKELACKDEMIAAKDAEIVLLRERIEAMSSLEDENRKLKASLAKDSGNSSIPSSKERSGHKHVQNNRERTGRRPGGQSGHRGHHRQVPAGDIQKNVDLFIDDERIVREGLVPTGKVIEKRVAGLLPLIEVTTYRAHVYRTADGRQVHAPFPEVVGHNEVGYSPALKAFLYRLVVSCKVSVRDAGDFIADITGGRLHPSTGFIQSLVEEFAAKSENEAADIFSSLVSAASMNVDFTGAKVCGHGRQVLVCCNGEHVLYQMKEHKGHEGVKGSPLELFDGLVYHDHDKTFFSYGNAHQECLVHIRRYLKGVVELEPERKWAKEMLDLFNDFFLLKGQQRVQMSDSERQELVTRYSTILEKALDDYSSNPPSKWIRDGHNLARRLQQWQDSVLAFLYDPCIEKDNNRAERLLRTFKRKMSQMTGFRSDDGGRDMCVGLSVVETLKANKADVYATMQEIFARAPHKRRKKVSSQLE